ncbi:uncharacterized protein [Clytia hemisphaerica]|uniref:uncharacterized protein n=1 Tax=Clytia hemisphaerica TaxID=252671 RepID=UPI0034D654DF
MVFCFNFGIDCGEKANFCGGCGTSLKLEDDSSEVQDRRSSEVQNKKGPTTYPRVQEKEHAKVHDKKGNVLTYKEFAKSKSSAWFQRVTKSGKGKKKTDDVGIFVGVLAWHKGGILKKIHKKRISLKLSPESTYDQTLKLAKKRIEDYFPGTLDSEELYHLAYETGVIAYFIPGTTTDFILSKYREDSGIEYKDMNLCLLSDTDKLTLEHIEKSLMSKNHEKDETNDEDKNDQCPPSKRTKSDFPYYDEEPDFSNLDGYLFTPIQTVHPFSNDAVDQQAGSSSFQSSLHSTDSQHTSLPSTDSHPDSTSVQQARTPSDHTALSLPDSHPDSTSAQQSRSTSGHTSLQSASSHPDSSPVLHGEPILNVPPVQVEEDNQANILNNLSKNVNYDEQFFLTLQRNFSLNRAISVWSRQKKQSPTNRLMVTYIGENGIDAGAVTREFLTTLMAKIGTDFFPDGAPKESMLDVQNCNFLFIGQMIAVSLLEGGPPPTFFHESVYDLLVDDTININKLNSNHFTEGDKLIFQTIRNDPTVASDIIIENGYTGLINMENIDAILQTIMISIISRRKTYLSEISKGLELFGLMNELKLHKSCMKSLFVPSEHQEMDFNYLLSIIRPQFDSIGTNRRKFQQDVLDFFQDFFCEIEDQKISLPDNLEVAASAELDDENTNESSNHNVIVPDLSIKGILGWLTGQKHRPLFGEPLSIPLKFDYDCYSRYPEHTICYPYVHACSREFSLPVSHIETYADFKNIFLTALCKGQSFGRP